MDHDLMFGMFVAGFLMSAFPIALGIGLGVLGFRIYRSEREAERRREEG